jgi:transposase
VRKRSTWDLFEYGYVFPQGITHVSTLVAHVEDPQSSLPESARAILKLLVDTFTALEDRSPKWMSRSTGA